MIGNEDNQEIFLENCVKIKTFLDALEHSFVTNQNFTLILLEAEYLIDEAATDAFLAKLPNRSITFESSFEDPKSLKISGGNN